MITTPSSIGLCCGTVVQAPDVVTFADAAAEAGFEWITAWPTLVTASVDAGTPLLEIRRQLGDRGVTLRELDPVCTWLPVDIPDTSMTARFATYSIEDFFTLGHALGATCLNVIRADDDRSITDEQMVEHLGVLADRARGEGFRIYLEFLPWSPVATLDHALRIVEGVDRDNCAVHVDTWHLIRSGGTVEALGRVDPSRIGAVQLADLDPDPWDDLLAETGSGRRLPGDGDGTALEARETLLHAGFDGAMALEVFSRDLMGLTPADAAGRAAASAQSLRQT